MQKTAHHRKAVWLTAAYENTVLEDALREALDNRRTVDDTKFQYNSEVVVQISSRIIGDFVGCFFTLYSEGEPAGTVEKGGPGLGSVPPPVGEEFLKTGIYLVAHGNEVAFLADGHTNDGQINNLFHSFFKHAGLSDTQTQFALMPRANRNEVERLLSSGVKSIDIGVSDFITAIDQMNLVNGSANPISKVKKVFTDIFATDRSSQEREIASKIQGTIHLGFDGRSSPNLLPEIMGEISNKIYNEDFNEFKFKTKDGITITKEKLAIKTDVTINDNNSIIDANDAFTALNMALNNWRTSGVLDE